MSDDLPNDGSLGGKMPLLYPAGANSLVPVQEHRPDEEDIQLDAAAP